MKIGNFEIHMQRTNKTSGILAILKTCAFFGIIIAIVYAATYFVGRRSEQTTDVAAAAKDGYKRLDIDDLASFEYYTPLPGAKPNPERLAKNKIPDNIKGLNGTRVSVSGFMMPVRVDDVGNVEEFALNGNYDRCFYGAPSQINQWIHVKMKQGLVAKASHSPVTVSGTLEVGELIEDGEVISLYRLVGDKSETQQRRSF